MEDLFNEIQTAIAENMPSVSLVDEDYGQLQTEEDHYPVTFPAVLINMEGVAWETITDEYLRGTFTITIKLCLDCYDDTHYTSGVATEEPAHCLFHAGFRPPGLWTVFFPPTEKIPPPTGF